MQRALLLDVVIAQRPTVFQLLASKDQTLLVRRDPFLVLNLGFHVVDCVRGFDFEGDRLAGERLRTRARAERSEARRWRGDNGKGGEMSTTMIERKVVQETENMSAMQLGDDTRCALRSLTHLDKDLHTATQPQHQMQGRLLLNVIVAERPSILELFPGKNQPLLIRRNTFFILDLALDVVDRIARFHFQRYRLARQRFHKDLHTAAQTQDEVQGGLLLNVVIAERAAVLELFAGENESLLVGRDAFLVLSRRRAVKRQRAVASTPQRRQGLT